MEKNKEVLTKYLLPVFAGLIMVGGIIYAATWTGPTSAPPGSNVSAPINTGPEEQTKGGMLNTASGLKTPAIWDSNDNNFVLDPSGSSFVLDLKAGGKLINSEGTGFQCTCITVYYGFCDAYPGLQTSVYMKCPFWEAYYNDWGAGYHQIGGFESVDYSAAGACTGSEGWGNSGYYICN